jgi:hypothetical protein
MNSLLRRAGSAVSPVALLVAILALVISAAGVGYAAGQIGTKQIKNKAITAKKIKNNAITTKKIKKDAVTGDKVADGSLTAADLVRGEKQRLATLGNGGEGDCAWQSAGAVIPTLGAPTFRKDPFGTVHLSGIALGNDAAGGDASCDSGDPGQSADAIVFTLPAGYVPVSTRFFGNFTDGLVIVTGAQGLTIGTLTLPPGAVASTPNSDPILLDGISFEPAGSSVSLPKMAASGRISADLAGQLGLN